MSTEENSSSQDGDAVAGSPESLEQIREILFGTKSRDIDDRFQEINDRIAEAVGGLRSLIGERTEAMQQRLDQELHALREDLGNLRRSADERFAQMDNKSNDTANDIRQQLGALSETLSAAERSVRSDMDLGMAQLKEQLASQIESMHEQLQRDVGSLSASSVSRRSFRDALRELSTQFDDG